MFSGEDSSGDALNNAGQFATWAISQTTCNNSGNEQVDWAALAQQWIQMKESTSYAAPPLAPPPPTGLPSINAYEEKGEADMEVVREDENGFADNTNNTSAETENFGSSMYRMQSEWQSSWYPDQTQWRGGWNNWPVTTPPAIAIPEINAPPPPSMTIMKPTSPISKVTSPEPTAISSVSSVDAIKRKTLPAWIREGLEKMEKEKLKQQLKETQKKPVTTPDVISKNLNVSPVRLANDIIKVRSEKSFQESDHSGDETEPENDGNDDFNNDNTDASPISSRNHDTPLVTKSREEILEEWMLVVRRSLTELLLEVTNEEIQSIAQETLRKLKSKASSAQVFRKSAISSITGKLGLGAYADSASENSESEEDDHQNHSDSDSEDELKETIRSRQIAFKAIAQEIEESARESELKEQRRNAECKVEKPTETKSVRKGYDIDSGEPQPDKKSQYNGKRPRERTSRFSDAKDMKNRANAYTLVPPTPVPSSSSEFEPRKQSSSLASSAVAPSSSKTRKYSGSSSSSSNSSDSYERYRQKRSSGKSHKSSNNGSRRENSHDSFDSDDYSSRRSKKYNSRSSYSRDRSRSRSRSRSKSQSYTGKSRR